MDNRTVAHIAPFVSFVVLLGAYKSLPIPDVWAQALFVAVIAAILWFIGRPAISLNVTSWVPTILLGLAVFAIWVAPDLLFPGYRHSVLFENSVMGKAATALPEISRGDSLALVLRASRAILLVPILEELFWRSWLMRWLISADFERVPMGTFSMQAFLIVAVAFASEHGSYWDVGLAAGLIYNWWMIRTKSLGDLILAHAVTNAALSAYVVFAGKWEYWL